MANHARRTWPWALLAFVLGAAIAAAVCVFALGQFGNSGAANADGAASASAATGASSIPAAETASSASAQPASEKSATASDEHLDVKATFPSWNPNSASLAELVAFVDDVTDEGSAGYVEPADRIATFDMDGTILCEKAPVYIDYCVTLHRALDDPTYEASETDCAAMEEIRYHAWTEGATFHPEGGPTKDDMIATAFAGMTTEEFRDYVTDFADTTDAVGFSGMTYAQSFYKPMLEVIDYLRANDFDVWIVSTSERELVRALVERIGIPYDHVIATDVALVATDQQGEDADDYTMESDEEIVLSVPLLDEVAKTGKPIAIAHEIGKRPILAFGNSSGDYAMLNYTEGNAEHPGMGLFVVADDEEREYGNAEKASKSYEMVEEEDWTAFSMADDWATIYGEGVQKTGLPGEDGL